jgi:hypothetical protein
MRWRTLAVCAIALQCTSLWAEDRALRINLLKNNPGRGGAIEPVRGPLTNIDLVYVEVCADRKNPLFGGKPNPALSFPGAKNSGWHNPESFPISLTVWRGGDQLRPVDFTMEGDTNSLDPNQACSRVSLTFPVPSKRRQSEEDRFWPEFVAMLESGIKTPADRSRVDELTQGKARMMASFRQNYRESPSGKYAVTATVPSPDGPRGAAAVSEKLGFEIEDGPGFYRWLLDRMKSEDRLHQLK